MHEDHEATKEDHLQYVCQCRGVWADITVGCITCSKYKQRGHLEGEQEGEQEGEGEGEGEKDRGEVIDLMGKYGILYWQNQRT